MPSGNDGLLGIPPAEMTDDQLDAAVALFGCTQRVEARSLDYDED